MNSNIPTITGPVEFEPISDFILIEPIPHTQTAGGIALPDNASHQPPKARVIKCGPGHRGGDGQIVPMPVKEGDVVYMMVVNGQGLDITLGGRQFGVVRGRDLIGKVAA